MKELIRFVPIVLYFFAGFVCLVMANKCLIATKFLPFHEQAAGKPWEAIDAGVQLLILFLIKLVGLGFLINALLLLVFPVVELYNPSPFIKYTIPTIAILFCAGLAYYNYHLYKITGADTPWKKSLYAIIALMTGIILSFITSSSMQ